MFVALHGELRETDRDIYNFLRDTERRDLMNAWQTSWYVCMCLQAESGGRGLSEQKLLAFREQLADCGLLKPVTVPEEVYQATSDEARKSQAVDKLVRGISQLQAAIRHLLSLLDAAVEQTGQGLSLSLLVVVVLVDCPSVVDAMIV